jgi:hypothetical protein
MKFFTHLSDKSENSILKLYDKRDLINKLVVRDEMLNKFIVFENYEEYIQHWKTIPDESKCFHEIIFGFNSQKIKFDIDIEVENLEHKSEKDIILPPSQKIVDEINLIIDTIIQLFEKYYNIIISYDDIIVTDSSGSISPTRYKFSYHIIIFTFFVENNKESEKFTLLVYDQLPENIQPYIDRGVNKQIQNFRLLGCKKKKSDRFKKISELFHSKREGVHYIDTIITIRGDDITIRGDDSTIRGDDLLPPLIIDNECRPSKTVNNKIIDTYMDGIIEWLEIGGYINDHQLRCINGGIISFNRIASREDCRICNRVHHNDNSLFIQIKQAGKNAISVIEYCHRNPKKYKTLVEGLVLKKQEADTLEKIAPKISYLQKSIDRVLSSNKDTAGVNNFNKEIYSEEYMRPYPIEPNTLCIKAQMGCGKTKAMKDYITNYFPDEPLPQVIRFLTFRQTFARALLDSFSDFTIYSDITGDINQNIHKRVIIQVESLHRINITKYIEPINLLILDEVESILMQFNSGLHQHFNAAFAAFQWMLLTAEKVICIDANLSERTLNILRRMRPNHEIFFHHNTFHKERENIYKITNNNSEWLSIMLNFLSNDKKIVLPSNSKLEAEVYMKLIEEMFPNKRIKLYSSDMSASEKNEHFSNVEKYWSQLDVLIYTPTCSAGISFELDHFDMVFAHFTDASCDVETCRQMLMRVRNLRTKTYYIYIPPYSSNMGNYPTTTEEISSMLKNKKIEMFKDIDHSNLHFEYTKDGDIVYFESNYFHLWLENVRIENLSKNNFVERFIAQVVECGATVSVLEGIVTNKEIGKTYKNIKHSVKDSTANFIATAKDITLEEIIEIQDRKQCGGDICIEEIYSCDKFHLCENYKLKDRDIVNKEFVLIYNNENVKRVFKYMTKICSYPTVEEALIDMQRKDVDMYSSIGGTPIGSSPISSIRPYQEGVEYYNLVKYKYIFTNHLSLQELIKICGFSFTDIFINLDKRDKKVKPNLISLLIIEKKLRENLFNIEKYLLLLIPEMNIPKAQSNISVLLKKMNNETDIKIFVKRVIKLINFGLRTFYGIEVEKNTKDEYLLIMGKIALLFNYKNKKDNKNEDNKCEDHKCEDHKISAPTVFYHIGS